MSALLEFRKPPADIIKYPPTAIWRQKRKRRIKLPKGRRQLKGKELAKRFGKGFSFVGDGGMMSYEETRARADAVQAQRVRGERLAILDREIQNDRDRLRLQGEINQIEDRYRQRKLDIEQARFEYRIDQDARREARELDLLDRQEFRRAEEAERFERVRAEDHARYDRLIDDQRRFFADFTAEGERRRGEYDARLLDAVGNLQRQSGGNAEIRFVVEPVEEEAVGGGIEDITSPRPAPAPEPEPAPAPAPPPQRDLLRQRLAQASPTSPDEEGEAQGVFGLPLEPTESQARESLRRSFVDEGEEGGGTIRQRPTPEEIALRGRQLAQEAQEDLEEEVAVVPQANIADLERRIEAEPETALQQLGRGAANVVGGVVSALTGGGGGGVASIPIRSGEQSGGLGVAIQREEGAVAEGVFGATEGEGTFALPDAPRSLPIAIPQTARTPRTPRGASSPIRPLIQGDSPERELAQLLGTPSPTRSSSPAVRARQERQEVRQSRSPLDPPRPAPAPEPAPARGQVEVVEQEEVEDPAERRQRLRIKELKKERKLADTYEPVNYEKDILGIQQEGRKLRLPADQGELFLEVREPFDRANYVGQTQGLYKVKAIPAKAGSAGGANTMKYNLTYTHGGRSGENQLDPRKIKGGKNVFEEALGDGKIRFVLKRPS
tara:strand:- start:8680 stop:10677 length:1998 start_codon:yes stop_codon:yes gene_type:complete